MMRTNPKTLLLLLVLSLAAHPGARAAEASGRPNILLIVADDLGWADVGWHGGKFKTPNMDKLVREGVELDRHYVQPVCSPTRAALLSGRWTSRFGPHALSPTNRRVFAPGTTTLASALKQCGYTTHIAGKWHLGSRPEWGPNHYGFDRSYGSLNGAVDPWTHKYRKGPYEDTWHRDLKRVDEEGNATELVAREVHGWLREAKEPWFIYVPFHAVHIPVDAPDEFKRPYTDAQFDADEKRNESLRRFGAFVSQMDAKIGAFVAALEASGQRANTLIVFTSDNGGLPSGGNPYVGTTPPTPALSSNLPLRGHKNELYEGGIRVCAFANWPGKLRPRKVTAPQHAADWMPTLTRLAGWQPEAAPKFDGRDVWPLLTGIAPTPEPRAIYVPHPSGAALLHGEWKLIARKAGKEGAAAKTELFHITEDPFEQHNVGAQHPERVSELETRLSELRRDDLTELPEDLKDTPN